MLQVVQYNTSFGFLWGAVLFMLAVNDTPYGTLKESNYNVLYNYNEELTDVIRC